MIWLLFPLSALSLFLAGLVGYKWRELVDGYKTLQLAVEALKTRQDKVMPEVKPDAILLDEEDIVQRAQFEHDEIQRKLNGGRP